MLRLTGGLSQKDRISFSTTNDVATAIRKSDGKIDVEFGKANKSSTRVEIILSIIFWATPFIKAFIIIPLIKSGIIGVNFYLTAAFIYLFIAIYVIIRTRITEGKKLLKNHAAEHMVYSAYKKLKRVPTIEESKHFSRISKYCGITIYSGFITIQVIAFIVYIHTGYIISEILLFISAYLFRTIFPFNILGKFAQLFTTSKPEDENIELAIAAVSALETRQQIKEETIKILRNTFRF